MTSNKHHICCRRTRPAEAQATCGTRCLDASAPDEPGDTVTTRLWTNMAGFTVANWLISLSHWLNCRYTEYRRTGRNYTRFDEDVQLHFCVKANRGLGFFVVFFIFGLWLSGYSAVVTTSSKPNVQKVSELFKITA